MRISRNVNAQQRTELWTSDVRLLLGMLMADFISGIVHWAADTWDRVTLPIIGPRVLMAFRNHHVNPLDITKKDFINVNGHNILLALFAIASAAFVSVYNSSLVFVTLTILFFGITTLVTNQIHQFAHMKNPPRFARVLQRSGIILTCHHHQSHHTAPFTTNYCITTEWLNTPLRYIRFFAALESTITFLTGAIARGEEHEVQSRRKACSLHSIKH